MTKFSISDQQFRDLMLAYSDGEQAKFALAAREMLAQAKELTDNDKLRLNSYVPIIDSSEWSQGNAAFYSEFARIMQPKSTWIKLPPELQHELAGVKAAINSPLLVRKFLFAGEPGTGKTASVAKLAKDLGRELVVVDSPKLIDSHLGNSPKNIVELFNSFKNLAVPDKVIILFDEIDMLAMDRFNQHDLREMGRVTSVFLREMDRLAPNLVVIATTNLADRMDPALRRRFDLEVDFNQYTQADLKQIGDVLARRYLKAVGVLTKRNLISELDSFLPTSMTLGHAVLASEVNSFLPLPAELDHAIKVAVAFSGPDYDLDTVHKNLVSHIKNCHIEGK